MKVKNTENNVGIEVSDVQISTLTPAQWGDIQQLFSQNGLMFFRDQQLTEDDHIAFAERWGTIDINKFFPAVANYPQIAEVRKEPEQKNNIGEGWHTDHTYDAVPAMGSILVARELPSKGGDTLFASMYKPVEMMSEGLLDTLRSLRAVHSAAHIFAAGSYKEQTDLAFEGAELAAGEVSHPIIVKHPLSGKESLYVNSAFTVRIEGWTTEESQPLLQYLYQFAINCNNTMTYKWQPGSIAFWDNRAMWHFALNDYQGERRLMHRITIEGCALS